MNWIHVWPDHLGGFLYEVVQDSDDPFIRVSGDDLWFFPLFGFMGVERSYFECFLLCLFFYLLNYLFRWFVIENLLSRFTRNGFSLGPGDLFPIGSVATLGPSVFSKGGINNYFKEPDFDVGGNISDETRQQFFRNTNHGNAKSTGTGHRHQFAAMLTKWCRHIVLNEHPCTYLAGNFF